MCPAARPLHGEAAWKPEQVKGRAGPVPRHLIGSVIGWDHESCALVAAEEPGGKSKALGP